MHSKRKVNVILYAADTLVPVCIKRQFEKKSSRLYFYKNRCIWSYMQVQGLNLYKYENIWIFFFITKAWKSLNE